MVRGPQVRPPRGDDHPQRPVDRSCRTHHSRLYVPGRPRGTPVDRCRPFPLSSTHPRPPVTPVRSVPPVRGTAQSSFRSGTGPVYTPTLGPYLHRPGVGPPETFGVIYESETGRLPASRSSRPLVVPVSGTEDLFVTPTGRVGGARLGLDLGLGEGGSRVVRDESVPVYLLPTYYSLLSRVGPSPGVLRSPHTSTTSCTSSDSEPSRTLISSSRPRNPTQDPVDPPSPPMLRSGPPLHTCLVFSTSRRGRTDTSSTG